MVKKSLNVCIVSLCFLVLPLTSRTVAFSPSFVALTPPSVHAQNPKTYRVKLGDTLSGIAVKFGLTIDQLLTYNPSLKTNPDLLQIGKIINLTKTQNSTRPSSPVARSKKSTITFNLPSKRRTGSRVMAGRRSEGESCFKNPDQSLKILLPDTIFGYTLQDYPTFFWYVPELVESSTTEFRLRAVSNKTVIYKATIKPNSNTIASFSLPPDAPPLKEGEEYQWEITIKCNQGTHDPVAGRIQRLTSNNPVLEQQLEQAAIEDYPAILAEAGIWYDALATLAALRREKPTDQNLSQDWAAILKKIDYEDLKNIPEVKITAFRSN